MRVSVGEVFDKLKVGDTVVEKTTDREYLIIDKGLDCALAIHTVALDRNSKEFSIQDGEKSEGRTAHYYVQFHDISVDWAELDVGSVLSLAKGCGSVVAGGNNPDTFIDYLKNGNVFESTSFRIKCTWEMLCPTSR